MSRLVSSLAADLPRALTGDPGRAGGGAGAGLGAGRRRRARRGRRAGHRRPGRHHRDRPLRETAGRAHLEEDVRLPPADRLRRPRRGRERGAAGHHAAGGERRVEHGRRPYRGYPAGAGAAAAPPAAQGADPRRLRRRHARVPALADREVRPPALLGRHDDHRGHAERHPQGPGGFLDARLTTAAGRSGTGRGSPRSPACWTCPPGRPGCGSSSARNARTLGRSCGSPTSTGTGSPPSPPTRRRASSPTWNCGTGAGPAARTGSAAPRTPGCATCRCKGFAQNQIWCEIVALACELLAWTQMLALTGTARRWEPKRLRLRLFSVAGRLVRGGRRLRLRLAAALALGPPDHRRSRPPASPPLRLTSRNHPCDTGRSNPRGPWNPAHPARQPGSQPRPAPQNHHQPNSSGQRDGQAKDRG